MHNFLTIKPIELVDGIINLPGSKSVSNRALLLAAQSTGTTHLINLLDSDDIRYMLAAFDKLGIKYCLSTDRRRCEIIGLGRPLCTTVSPTTLFLGNAGTVMRPLLAALCIQIHNVTLNCAPRMKKRPIGQLVDALCQGGAQIDYLEQDYYPPLRVRGGYKGGNITVDGSISSQFITALLMMAPLAPKNSCIRIKGKLVSRPYVDLTLSLMKRFGIEVQHDNYQIFHITGNSSYRSPGEYLVEGDASSASYFLAAAAIKGGTVRVTGIGRNSVQGDIYFADVLKSMGANISWGKNYIECSRASSLHAIDMDMNHIPDTAMTIATTSLFTKGGTTILRNIANWRIKESDRLTAMATELRKVGATVIEGKDYIAITPPTKINTACISTYNDHRIAMCFTLVALSNNPVTIIDPKCTNKTFPDFFAYMNALSFPKQLKIIK